MVQSHVGTVLGQLQPVGSPWGPAQERRYHVEGDPLWSRGRDRCCGLPTALIPMCCWGEEVGRRGWMGEGGFCLLLVSHYMSLLLVCNKSH